MVPTKTIRNQAMELLAADATTFAPAADAIHMALVKAPMVVTEALLFSDLTLADFDGSTPINIKLNAQGEGFDPTSGDSVIDILPPAGGFRWETTGITNLPQTIYGYVVLNNANTVLYAAHSFPAPIVLSAAGQRIDGLDATIRLPANTMF